MRCVAVTLLLLLVAASASGRDGSPADDLVRKLGDAVPEQREQAAEALRKLGKTALPALEAGLGSEDAEIRRACTDILDEIRADRGPRIEGFLGGVDPKDDPFPGWATFKKAAGEDRIGRLAYLALLESNPEFLAKLEKDPKEVTAKAGELCMKLWNRQLPGGQRVNRTGDILAALTASALQTNPDPNAFNHCNNMLYQPDVRTYVMGNLAARRMVSSVLANRAGKDTNQLMQTAYLATSLNLTEYIRETLVPGLDRMIDGLGDKADDPNKIQQIVNLAQITQQTPAIRPKMVPLVRKLAEAGAKSVADGTAFNNPNALSQAINCCQNLGLVEISEEILKPAVRKMIQTLVEKPGDINRFYQTINLARMLQLETELNRSIQPAVCRMIADAARNPSDTTKFDMALNLARTMNLNEAVETVLRPAGQRRIIEMLEQPPDFNRLTQAIYQARNLGLSELMEETLKPLFQRQAAVLLEKPEFNQLQQMYYLTQNIGDAGLAEASLKPALVKIFKDEAGKALNSNLVPQALQLARQMGCAQEAMPLARRAALSKDFQGQARGTAILTVVEFGSKEDLAALEPLLSETTQASESNINTTSYKCQIRDIVLGGLAFKAGQSLADLGYPYYKAIPQQRPYDGGPMSLGFASEDDRQAAFRKWEQTRKESQP